MKENMNPDDTKLGALLREARVFAGSAAAISGKRLATD